MTYSEVLRQEVKHLRIKVSVVEPAFFKTNLIQNRARAAKMIDDYDHVRKNALSVLEENINHGGDPQEVADLIAKIIETPSPLLHYAVGKEKRYLVLKRILSQSVMESQVRKHWQLDR